MPTFPGVKTDAGIEVAQDVYTSDNLFIARDYWTGDVLKGVDWPGAKTSTSRNDVVADPHTASYGGSKANDFAEDWYFRVHTIPAQVLLGNVTSNREVPVTIWNAFLSTKVMTAVDAVVTDGVIASPPVGFVLPHTMKPLEQTTFILRVSTVGPSAIDATFDLTVDGINYSLPVRGLRSVAFYFPPNWKAGAFEETYQANSWVFRSSNGTEQSGTVSGVDQRRVLSYGLTLTREQAQEFSNIMFTWQDRAFGVPHWAEKTKTTTAALAGDLTLACDTTKRSFREGGAVIVFHDANKWESRTISELTASGVTLTTPLEHDWPSGSRVYPMLPGFAATSVSTSWVTDSVMRVSLQFQLEPSEAPSNLTQVAPPLTYNGQELYLGKINWREALPVRFESNSPRQDKGTGKLRTIPTSGFAFIKREHTWLVKNIDEADKLRQFLARRKGVARRVYMPSGTSDFTLTKDALVSESTIDVTDNQYAGLIGSHPARRRVIIVFRDGTYLCRKIMSSSVVDGTGTARLLLDTPHGRDILKKDVKRISFLALYRMASNNFTIRWLTDTVGEARAEMAVVREPD